MVFLNKWYFLLLIFIPIIIYLIYTKQKKWWIQFKFMNDIYNIFWKYKYIFRWKIFLVSLILLLFIIILANPNKPNTNINIKKNGIDIVFALDVSESMNAEDLKPTRIEAAKHIIDKFVSKLKNDRVWLVIFAGEPFTSLPLTFDYNIVKHTISWIKTSILNKQAWLWWTAIWDWLLMAQTLFKPPVWTSTKTYSKRQKIIILLTDGNANKWVNPVIAWEYLKKHWIKVYTIWIWSKQWWYISYKIWPFVQHAQIPPLKEWELKQIAKITDWKFYRATNTNSLYKIFNDLENLTKTNINVKVKKTYNPEYIQYLRILLVIMWIFIYLKTKEL